MPMVENSRLVQNDAQNVRRTLRTSAEERRLGTAEAALALTK